MNHAAEFAQGYWSFLGPGDEEKCFFKPQWKWNATAWKMAVDFRKIGHPVL